VRLQMFIWTAVACRSLTGSWKVSCRKFKIQWRGYVCLV